MVVLAAVAMMVLGAAPVRGQDLTPFGQGRFGRAAVTNPFDKNPFDKAAAPTPFNRAAANPFNKRVSAAPSQGAAPLAGTAAPPAEDCMKSFTPLREETEKRGKELQALGANGNHPTAAQGCAGYDGLAGAMHKMLSFVDSNGARCGIPGQVGAQIREQEGKLEEVRKKVCDIARLQQREPTLKDFRGAHPCLIDQAQGETDCQVELPAPGKDFAPVGALLAAEPPPPIAIAPAEQDD